MSNLSRQVDPPRWAAAGGGSSTAGRRAGAGTVKKARSVTASTTPIAIDQLKPNQTTEGGARGGNLQRDEQVGVRAVVEASCLSLGNWSK